MQYTTLGRRTGLRISEFALGTGNFGTRRSAGSEPDEARLVFDRFVEGQRDRVERLERGPQAVEVPFLGVAGGSSALDVTADDVVDHRSDLVGKVQAFEDAPA